MREIPKGRNVDVNILALVPTIDDFAMLLIEDCPNISCYLTNKTPWKIKCRIVKNSFEMNIYKGDINYGI